MGCSRAYMCELLSLHSHSDKNSQQASLGSCQPGEWSQENEKPCSAPACTAARQGVSYFVTMFVRQKSRLPRRVCCNGYFMDRCHVILLRDVYQMGEDVFKIS